MDLARTTHDTMTKNGERRDTIVAVALLILVVAGWGPPARGECPQSCSGHGRCSRNDTCVCDKGFLPGDCSRRSCPEAPAFVDYATADDTAHLDAECSNMGICNRATGTCTCRSGFTGMACEYMDCPADADGVPCNGRGRCMSMRDASRLRDDRTLFSSFTYTSNWDADKIYGCVCDPGFEGYDCSLISCPKGDDPLTTGQVDEIQVVECLCNPCSSGYFKLRFRGEWTDEIAYNEPVLTTDEVVDGSGQSLESKLEALQAIDAIEISKFDDTSNLVCDADGTSIAITFAYTPGDLPEMVAYSSVSTLSVDVKSDGEALAGYGTPTAPQTGTREELVCSGRGLCDYATGQCTCETLSGTFTGSNGAGGSVAVAAGTRADCGYTAAAITACPSTSGGSECNGQACGGAGGDYQCVCSGYMGAACELRTCATGNAWFEEATANDVAHTGGAHECSNRGVCDRTAGTCTCQDGFDGAACNTMACPVVSSSTCNSKGTCSTIATLAQASTRNNNGDPISPAPVYGGETATWDADMVRGCACDTGYFHGPFVHDVSDWNGYDCSLQTCPTGDDPMTEEQVHEIQVISCQATGGTFTLSFRGRTTSAISFDAVLLKTDEADDHFDAGDGIGESIQSKIYELLTNDQTGYSIDSIAVSYSSGTILCGNGENILTTITFLNTLGDIPLVTVGSNTLTGSPSISVYEAQKGTMEDAECSNKGLCDTAAGVCRCHRGFTSSDGSGGAGSRGDCGYMTALQTVEGYPTAS